jgi:hypothetical protein
MSLRVRLWIFLFCLCGATVMADERLIIDDRSSGNLESALGSSWRMFTDGVMGGVSTGTLTPASVDQCDCLRLQGDVRLENNGGFVQAALDVEDTPAGDASAYTGIEIEVYGNDETYNLHLRTDDLWLPWQSYRTTFAAPARWQTLQLPFAEFSGYRTWKPLDVTELERIGVVAIGRAFTADLCIGRVGFYSGSSG